MSAPRRARRGARPRRRPDARQRHEAAGRLAGRARRPRGLDELGAIAVSGTTLEIGAMATLTSIIRSSEVEVSRPILAEVAATVADVQVRNRGTLGGNICVNDPTNHFPPLLVALGATMTIRSAGGERTVPADEFFVGVFETAVGEGDLLTGSASPPPEGTGDGMSGVTLGAHGPTSRTRRRRSPTARGASRSAVSRACRSGRRRWRRCSPGSDVARRPCGRGRGPGRDARPAVRRPRVGRLPAQPRRDVGRARRPAGRRASEGMSVAVSDDEPGRDGEVNGERYERRCRLAAARPLPPRRPRPHGHAHRVRHGELRRVHGPPRRRRREELRVLAVQADGASVTTVEGLARRAS